MRQVTVWKGFVSVHERCLLRHDGDYYGIATRTIYRRSEGYRHSPVYHARVISVDDANETGMSYRDRCNHPGLIGQSFDVEQAHYYGDQIVWRTVYDRFYLTSNEIELLDEKPIR